MGSRVGLLLDSCGNLHLYVDGCDQGVAKHSVSQPCFALFDIRNRVTKVRGELPDIFSGYCYYQTELEAV